MTHWIMFAAVAVPLFVFTGCGGITRSLYNSPWRARWQQPERVMQSLAIQPGAHVADLGAGGGYFTFRLADAVGPAGKVYAVDIDKGNLDYIAREARAQGYTNVETILAKVDDPLLPPHDVDLIFTCNVYHHLQNRADYFKSAARYLNPEGRVAIIDLNKAGVGWVHRLFLFGHWTPKETTREELTTAGYALTNDFTFLERQTFQMFKKNS